MKKWLLGSSMVFLLILAACGSSDGEETADNGGTEAAEDITIVLDWTPNTNHTGLYVARDKGYFEEEGLNAEIIMAGEAGADQMVASGNVDFGVGYQEGVTEARIQGVPIVSIAAVIQNNTSGFASLEETDITSPKDFAGKSYGGWGAPLEQAVLDSLMQQEDADVEDVEIVNIGDTDFFTAMHQGIDFAWIYYGWTGVEAELRGEDINIVYLTDYSENLNYYTPVLTTNEDMIEENPETIEKFLRAVSRGYQLAIDQPEEAAEILTEAVPDLDAELVAASQEWLAPRYQDEAPRWGEQQLEIWENYANWMYENGLLEEELDAEAAFTNEFLPE
jgi:ABC-type nitrate/sulfonate/bicarbonate transport system substrate-binding protein